MPSDADKLRAEIARLGRSQRGLARELGLDERTMRRYCSGELEVPPIVWAALKGLRPRKPAP
jgi:ribosome-binding protein aMBF1 (putative translation factor)